jgi:lysophospholipase L1-like esterase
MYCSGTLASTHNQKIFYSPTPTVARVFYRVFREGQFDYSLTFYDQIDSTFSDGSQSYANILCGDWCVSDVSLGVSDAADPTLPLSQKAKTTFGGEVGHSFAAGEIISTDPVSLSIEKNQYLCVEFTFFGNRLPHHPENLIPCFVMKDGEWAETKMLPLPSMIGCNAPVKKRVAFWGDSITQGIGTPQDSYLHYAAVAASEVGKEHAYWDIGIGYGRAQDAATLGAWMKKALENDVVTVCFGVNDILQGRSAEEIKADLTLILDTLKGRGVRVLQQSVPPFDYPPNLRVIWEDVNDYVRTTLAPRADAFFDTVPILALSESEPHRAKFGPHPNADGMVLWGKALAPVLRSLLDKQ